MQIRIRHQLTPHDIDFILECLADSQSEREALLKLLSDDETAIRILDEAALADSVLDSPEQLRISKGFYFFLLVRRTLRNAGINDHELAEFVASALCEFLKDDLLGSPEGTRSMTHYATDLEQRLLTASPAHRFFMHLAIGNHFLCATGMFPAHLRRRERRWGAPGIRFYEEVGSRSYRNALEHPYAREFALESVLVQLGREFRTTRRVLNDVADRLVFLS